MTEIDVPDWVVKAAEDARVRCLNAVTAYGSAGVDERYHMAMKPPSPPRWGLGWWWSMDALSAGDVILYTLAQDKPE